jgi:excisionase family DNA binding protein
VKQYLTTEEAAERLRCSVRTVQERIAKGRVPHRKIAGLRRVLIPADELEAMIDGAELETVNTANGGRVVRVKLNGGAS